MSDIIYLYLDLRQRFCEPIKTAAVTPLIYHLDSDRVDNCII